MRALSTGGVLLAILLLGCAAPSGPSRQATGNEGEAPRASAGPKRIVVGIRGTPVSPVMKVTVSGGTGQAPGAEELEELVNARLGMVDPDGKVRPQLAISVPTANDSSWTVLPSGEMDTTWKINPKARWHDGAPFTADDVIFSFSVWRDQEVAIFKDARYLTVQSLEAPDPLTLV